MIPCNHSNTGISCEIPTHTQTHRGFKEAPNPQIETLGFNRTLAHKSEQKPRNRTCKAKFEHTHAHENHQKAHHTHTHKNPKNPTRNHP